MPPRRRSEQTKDERELFIGIAGITPHEEKDVVAQLNDLVAPVVEAGRTVTVVIPVTPDSDNPTYADIIDWAADNEHSAIAITANEDDLTKTQKRFLKSFDDTLNSEGETVGGDVVSLLTPANVDGRLLVLWPDEGDEPGEDESDGHAMDALEAAWDGSVPAFNLRNALDPLLPAGDEEDEPEPLKAVQDEPEEEPAPRTRRREPEPEPEAAEDDEPKPRRRRRTKAEMEAARAAEAAGVEPAAPAESEPADEAQTEVRSNGNGHAKVDILDLLTDLIADKVAERLR